MKDIYLELKFDEHPAAGSTRYTNGNNIKLGHFGPIASFSDYKFSTSCQKRLEEINHALLVCLTYKIITSFRGSDEFFIGSDLNLDNSQRELTNEKPEKGKYFVRIMLKEDFGFAEW